MSPVFMSICAIVRNEAPYIGEWLEFHRLVGVERFYLFDDGSFDRTWDVIRKHDRGDIVFQAFKFDHPFICPEKVEFRATHQINAYNRFIVERRDETQWCAFIDVDEYLYHATHDDIREPLFEEAGSRGAAALFVNWRIFGSNGHATKPLGLTIEGYTQRAALGMPDPTGRHGKIIARMDALDYFGPYGSHNAVFLHGEAINERGEAVPGSSCKSPTADRWRLNHYYHRSRDEARARCQAADNNTIPGYRKTPGRMRKHDLNDIEDRDILRFLPRLQEAML
jgi:hypothetical protein